MTETYNISSGLKKYAAITAGLGVLLLILGVLFGGHSAGEAHDEGHGVATHEEHINAHHGDEVEISQYKYIPEGGVEHHEDEHEASHAGTTGDRFWANLLLCSYYFIGIGLGAMFIVATHQIGYGGWHILIKRIPEAMSSFVPVGGVGLILIVIGMALGWHHVYHWVHPDPADTVLLGKKAFLNIPFYSLRIVAYIVLWTGTIWLMRSISKKEDEIGVSQTYKKSKLLAALFIVVFAVTSSTGSWDIIMSINPHWYSTLFGWYNLASYVCGALAVMILITVYLQSQGYLKAVNQEHYHNLGMLMFGFSVFWTYLWFSQYMLIWYGNIPEATTYYVERMEDPFFKGLFFTILILNFFFPFFVLMTRNSKRNIEVLVLSAVVIFIGHWLDFFLMIMPHSIGTTATLGLIEFGMLFLFAGIFVFVVFNTLTKSSLIPVNNPYLKESIQHHTLK